MHKSTERMFTSPALAWAQLHRLDATCGPNHITRVCMGPTRRCLSWCPTSSHHPRSHGPNDMGVSVARVQNTSPALAWAQRSGRRPPQPALHITRARMGPTTRDEILDALQAHHPRSHGPNVAKMEELERLPTSPALAWAQPPYQRTVIRPQHITRARMGPTPTECVGQSA